MKKLNIDKGRLQHKYMKENKSSREVAQLFNCAHTTILRYLKSFKIPRKSVGSSLAGRFNRVLGSGESSIAWKGGSNPYWSRKAHNAWEEYWRECVPNGYWLHHFDRNRKNFHITNLALLTPQFHGHIHGKNGGGTINHKPNCQCHICNRARGELIL